MTEQLPPNRVQEASGANEPDPSVEKVTVPCGVDEPPPLVSVTVAVQFVPAPAFTGVTHDTEVDVERAVMLNVVLVAPVRDGLLEAVSVYPFPNLSIESVLNVAMPLDAA